MLAEAASDVYRCERWHKNVWDRLAYAARYGKQPLSELVDLELADLREFRRALSDIVEAESKAPNK